MQMDRTPDNREFGKLVDRKSGICNQGMLGIPKTGSSKSPTKTSTRTTFNSRSPGSDKWRGKLSNFTVMFEAASDATPKTVCKPPSLQSTAQLCGFWGCSLGPGGVCADLDPTLGDYYVISFNSGMCDYLGGRLTGAT